MTEGSGYVLEALREGAEFTLYRGRQDSNPLPILAVALTAEQPVTAEPPAARASSSRAGDHDVLLTL